MKKDKWELEREEARAKQEAIKAAELKAKLDMVRIEKKPYGRSHRKIGEMICDTGVKSGYQNATAKFTLRLDSHGGEFIAEHGDVWYVSKSRDALKAKMDEVARVTFDLKWTRYIKVEYEAEVPSRDSWRSGSNTLQVDDRREKGKPVYGISLKWEIVEYSDPIRLPGDEGERYMFREVEDGHPSSEQETKRELPAGLVVYTSERENFLKGLRLALTDLDRRMVELFAGKPDDVAKRLDTASGPLLLAPPKKGRR